jgi:CheY-like chemotaxis protein/HPt (histidine-containing phosphotransfer) domain-containing protein
MLGSWGMLVEHAADLTEAMTKLKSSAMLGRSWVYELLLIDAENFERDLPAFCNELRGLGDLHDMSVAVLTGSARLEKDLRNENNGHHVLRAPVKREQLRRHLYRLLDVEGSGGSAERLDAEPPRPVLDPLLNRDSELVIQPEAKTNKTGFSGKVLLVEDNPVNSSVAKRLLSRLGLSCVIAEHGGEALDCLERETFDLIFMDVQMPVMDGYAATRNIRHREADLDGRRIPIVAMTANAMAGDREKCLAAGMDDYIAKPVSAAKLRELIQVWLPQPSIALKRGNEAAEPVSFEPLDQAVAVGAETDFSRQSKPVPVSSSAATVDGDLIDADVVAELVEVMGEDFSGLVQTYLNNTPNYLEQIRAAVVAGDVKAAVLPVHSLKSSSANVGAMQLYDFAKQIEQLARTGSLPEVAAGYESLVDHFERAASELRRMIGADLTV